jgi:hypothetical protein
MSNTETPKHFRRAPVNIVVCFLISMAVAGAASAQPSPTALRGTVDGHFKDNDCLNFDPGTTVSLEMTGQFVFGKTWRGGISTTLHRSCAGSTPAPWDTEATFEGIGLGRSSTASGTCQVLSVDYIRPSSLVLGVAGNATFDARLDCTGGVTNGSGTTPTGTFPIEVTAVAFYAFDACNAGFNFCGDGPQDVSGQILGVFSKAS